MSGAASVGTMGSSVARCDIAKRFVTWNVMGNGFQGVEWQVSLGRLFNLCSQVQKEQEGKLFHYYVDFLYTRLNL